MTPALSRSIAAIVLFLAGLQVPVFAQQAGKSTLTGTITDPQGAVVSGVKVIATLESAGVRRETVSNDQGLYVLTDLAPGEYELRVEAKGFITKVTKVPISLMVGQSVTVDVPLEIGLSAEVIADDFSYEPRLIDSSASAVQGVIGSRDVENLPLNGRNFLELALLIPGNAPAPNFDPTKTNTVVISSAGQLGRGGNVTIDGADNNDDVVGGPVQNISQEAIQEFQIATNRYSAQLGRSGSSVINVVTKSGSNDLHGSASAYFRDRELQGLPATFDRNLGQTPPFERQQYAFTLGGPIKRDRAWFFGSFEYRNQDGVVLVGARDLATRSIRRDFAAAPLDDFLTTERVDWSPATNDHLSFRYSFQREKSVAASTLVRAIGSASQRQSSLNKTNAFLANYSHIISPRDLNNFSFSFGTFINDTLPVAPGPQLTFPSLQDGASFRVPQQTKQRRIQFSDTYTMVRGNHTFYFGGEVQRVESALDLKVFQQGRIELIEDFPDFDRDGDGRVDDNDLLFAVTLRSGVPDRSLLLPHTDNTYLAGFVQDDWHVHRQFTLNLGLRYELDTDVKNVSRVDELNPLILPFLRGERTRDRNNFAPRFGFNFSTSDGRTSVHGGYGIYYDRVTLEIQTLERGLDGRALPVEVRAGNLFFIPPPFLFDPVNGVFPLGAPTLANPFTGFVLPGAGAGGINIIDNDLQNPMVHQMNIGVQQELGRQFVLRADYLRNVGTHFIIGRIIGTVPFNPVVGGPDLVKNLESSVRTKYDGLLVSLEKRFSKRYQFRASYTLSRSFNFANDDQIPFSNGPIDSSNLRLEYGPTPNDQRHRFSFSGVFQLPKGIRVSPILTIASAVPIDILLPDGSSRVCELERNAGARQFHTGAELNAALAQINAAGGSLCPNADPGTGFKPRVLLPLVRDDLRLGDSFSSLDLRVSKVFKVGERFTIEPIAEVFNLFNVTNVLGLSNVNYSGFSNVLVRDSNDPSSPAFLRSSSFGQPVSTAGGVFGSGGPRAFQFAARVTF
ncbi:MAG TPA: carboxypeptidase regulatory-like domain-containing protein [Pyrinomonadaceae bacterium]|nr:carboxypeptidase regulatory-like domain-containing protein [Pyrinomonadaceae bacterium]